MSSSSDEENSGIATAHFSARLASAGSVDLMVASPRKPNPEISNDHLIHLAIEKMRFEEELTVSDLIIRRESPSLQRRGRDSIVINWLVNSK